MKNLPLLIATVLGTLLMIFAVGYFFSKQTSPETAQAVDPAIVAGERRLAKGPNEVAVTIVEFSDFQCPACRSTYPLTKQLMSEFDGKVQFIYRHFPLDTIHPNARLAAAASEVAHSYGKFWEMHDLLFENQDAWADISDDNELKSIFGDYAQQLQIDKTEFLTKIEEDSFAELVQADTILANQIEVQATPTFYVNGQITPAPQLKSVVQSILDNQAQ